MEKNKIAEQPITQPTQLSASKFIEIPEHHHWVWYMKKDSPWFELKSGQENKDVIAYGHVRSWIEENANGKVFIQFGTNLNKKETKLQDKNIYDDKIVVLFDDPTDYTAFKIVFPELCRI